MTESADDNGTIFPPLPCSEIVYRVARNKSSVDPATRTLTPYAFKRRPLDQDGLSTAIKRHCPLERARSTEFAQRCWGVGTLHVGRVRDTSGFELDVIQDLSYHANITGVPFWSETKEAEHCADLLAEQSRLEWP